MDANDKAARSITGGVDTHKDLHVAAVVDDCDRVLDTRSFATTRQGYRQMLAWMRAFGALQRIGIESTGSYGAGLLRYMQTAGTEVLRSRRLTVKIVANAERMTIWMPKAPPMPPLRGSGPLPREAGTEW